MEVEYEREDERERSVEVSALAQDLVDGRMTLHQALRVNEHVPLANDIEEDIEKFNQFSSRGRLLPCIEFPHAVPLPLDASNVAGHDFASWERQANAWRLRVEATSGFRTQMVPSPVVRTSFMERIAQALGLRAGGSDAITASGLNQTGLEVKVTTRSVGGRVFYSPATLFTDTRLFGAPTSPVTRPILPGFYLFGVENTRGAKRWDTAEHEVPPDYDIRLAL